MAAKPNLSMTAPSIDPISVAVIANRLTAITKEMGQIMLLTSRSPIFSESRDFVTAIFDAQGQLVAQTSYIPVLLGAIPFAMKAICRKYQNQELHAGDVIIANDPYEGNSHLPDVTIARPVFYQERLAFWSVTKGHQADLGGAGVAGYNPAAKTVWEEGLRLPAIKLYDRGKYQGDVWDLILLNVKSRHLVEGDLHCQIGATARGEEALTRAARSLRQRDCRSSDRFLFECHGKKDGRGHSRHPGRRLFRRARARQRRH